ncbi:hypothetical protein VTK73DRAFT_6555 [Phialemonium thermophilum]|uniref:Acetylserotonin methytransferase-like protein n=1 Tax=Phialemonium thermophilum TaxID=223376 RepID=A0ABR3XWD2_9PEZI
MAKLPIPPESTAEAQSSAGEPQALRSIFPTYNPNLPLDRQDYYPTQSSPTHIPRSAISRPLYSPDQWETGTQPAVRSPASMNGGLSGGATARWPPRHAEPPAHPSTSTGDELRGLWKVANGWKAQPSEGRVYCLKMTTEKDAPIYTLSSTTQPFYNLRLDPTSTSAYVTLSRRDPHKPVKSASSPGHNPGNTTSTGSSSTLTSIGKTDGKNWQEVLTTTLEEESRKLPPNDGLVALLYPLAAARMALERPDNAATVQLAEKECARLVWDADSSNYFVVHPALAMPFCVTVERSPALSRTEYTLEHIESPQHLGRLTRDGTGTGWLEIDTGIAAKIDAIYLVDVAVTALLLVAHKDEKFVNTEVFEPPPVLGTREGSLRSSRGGGRLSRLSLHNGNNSSSGRSSRNGRDSRQGQQRKKSKAKKSWPGKRMEEFEVDIESQTSELGKSAAKDKEKIPGLARGLIAILTFILKCIVWVIMIGFKSLAAVISGLAKCASSGK